jgi:hypothetical protein
LVEVGENSGQNNRSKSGKTSDEMEQYDPIYSQTTEVCIRVTNAKDGSKITEFTVKGNPDAATGKAAWYWSILDLVISEAGLDQEKGKGLFSNIFGRGR